MLPPRAGWSSVGAEQFRTWPTRDLWDESVADGEHGWHPPSEARDDDDNLEVWMRMEGLGLLYTYCWSPFRNPHGAPLVDCDILSGRVR